MKSFIVPIVLAITVSAQAAVIYDTYNTGDTYSNSAWVVNSSQTVATSFNVATASNFTSVKLSLYGYANYTVSLAVGGATTPGATLASWSVIGGGDVTLTPGATTALAAGDYYIVAESTGNFGGWAMNSIGYQAPFSYTNSNNWYSTSQDTGVMRIEAEAVPEPVSMIVLATGALALLRRRRSA